MVINGTIGIRTSHGYHVLKGVDRIIPVDHAYAAHTLIPGSRLEIFQGAGHYPHCEAPERFVQVLSKFIETTMPARITAEAHHVLRQT